MARKDDTGITVTDEDLLPDGASLVEEDSDNDGEFSIADLRVNFSAEEASSEARDFSPIPTGKYHVNITDVTPTRCGPKAKNPGKWYYALQLTVQDGPYENRKLFANVMLFEGALYTIAQIQKAQGWPINGQLPAPEDLMGTEYLCQVNRQIDEYKIKKLKEEDAYDPKEKPYKNEVKNFGKFDGSVTTNANRTVGAGDTLMP
jgi:uncharacterized protein DUF669